MTVVIHGWKTSQLIAADGTQTNITAAYRPLMFLTRRRKCPSHQGLKSQTAPLWTKPTSKARQRRKGTCRGGQF
uniref:Uncharacterized protein n=1 Tax=Hyaloperonospora arabidopsidis (strain Emoy2) TaxID=559515 RepID=M4BJI3_HYAAE